MSAESLFLKEAWNTVRRSLPDIVYLFANFFRRKALKFRAISQRGTLLERVTLTGALTLACGLVSYVLYRLDPFEGLEGIMPPAERAFWTALVPLIAAFLAYWLVRRPLAEPILSTFLNLGLVTCIALTVIPGVLSLAGAKTSAFATDVGQLQAGRGAGTPMHQIYCTTIQERAEINAMMRRLSRLSQRLSTNGRLLAQNGHALIESARLLDQNGRRLDAAGMQIVQAGGPGRAHPATLQEFLDTRRSGLELMRQGMALQREGMALQREGFALHREGFAIDYRVLDLQLRQSTAPYRLFGAYPVAAAFLIIAILSALLMWLFAAVIAWKLVVTPQPTRKRKIFVGASLVLAFLLVTVGFSLLRSGLLEVLMQEPPARDMLEAQLRTQFETAVPICGRLNNYGLW